MNRRVAVLAALAMLGACHAAPAPIARPPTTRPVVDPLARWDAAWQRLVTCVLPHSLGDLDPRDAFLLVAPYNEPADDARCQTDLWRDLADAIPPSAPPEVFATIAAERARAAAARAMRANLIDDIGVAPDHAGHHRLADELLDLDDWSADMHGNHTGADRVGRRRFPRAPASQPLASNEHFDVRSFHEGPYTQNPIDHAIRTRLRDDMADVVVAEGVPPATVVEPSFIGETCATATTTWTAQRGGKSVHWVAQDGTRGDLTAADVTNLSCAGDVLLAATDDGYATCSHAACVAWRLPAAGGGDRKFADLTTDGTAAVELRADGNLVALLHGTRVDRYRLAADDETAVGFAMWSTGPTILVVDAQNALRTITLPR